MLTLVLHAGGTGGLGLLTANWLSASRSSHLTLLGRSGRLSDSLGALASSPALVHVLRSDVTGVEEAAASVNLASRSDRGAVGIIHAAGLQVRSRACLSATRTPPLEMMHTRRCPACMLHKAS